MRPISIIIWILCVFFAAQAHSNECKLSAAQLHHFSQVLPNGFACDEYMLNITLDDPTPEFSLPIPFDLFQDNYVFKGLATFYGSSHPVTMNEWEGWKARYLTLLAQAEHADLIQEKNTLKIIPAGQAPINMKIYLGPATGEFSVVQYSYLWPWLAAMCLGIEKIFIILGSLLGNAWGMAIIALAVLFKFIFLPLQLWVGRLQRKNDLYEAILKPKLKEIKKQFDGEQAHQLIMAEYKRLGITPFYGMKPLIGPAILLPIQVAIFNVLGAMPELAGASFWWIEDLAYPDMLLPVLMTIISILSTLLMKKSSGKYYLYIMAIAFLVLFYPFPAAMVLFWTMMNMLHLVFMRN